MNYWIKLYLEILDDPKMGLLPDAAWRRAIEFYLLAGELGAGGKLPSLSEIAWRLRVPVEQLKQDISPLLAREILVEEDGGLVVKNFAKRQTPDSAADRQRRHRERKGNEPVTNYVTKRDKNVTPTLPESDIESESESDIESETESELKHDFSAIPSVNDLQNAFLEATRLPVGFDPRKWLEPCVQMAKAGVVPDDIRHAVDVLQQKGYTVVTPASVLNTAISEAAKRANKSRAGQRTVIDPATGRVIG